MVFPALAVARVAVRGSLRHAIIKAAVSPPPSQYPCYDAFLASRGAAWAIETAPALDAHTFACREVQPGGFTILRFADHRWRAVSAGDEVRCPFVSYPHQPTIPGQVLKQLTGHYCAQ
jgi:hypothetical protein